MATSSVSEFDPLLTERARIKNILDYVQQHYNSDVLIHAKMCLLPWAEALDAFCNTCFATDLRLLKEKVFWAGVHDSGYTKPDSGYFDRQQQTWFLVEDVEKLADLVQCMARTQLDVSLHTRMRFPRFALEVGWKEGLVRAYCAGRGCPLSYEKEALFYERLEVAWTTIFDRFNPGWFAENPTLEHYTRIPFFRSTWTKGVFEIATRENWIDTATVNLEEWQRMTFCDAERNRIAGNH